MEKNLSLIPTEDGMNNKSNVGVSPSSNVRTFAIAPDAFVGRSSGVKIPNSIEFRVLFFTDRHAAAWTTWGDMNWESDRFRGYIATDVSIPKPVSMEVLIGDKVYATAECRDGMTGYPIEDVMHEYASEIKISINGKPVVIYGEVTEHSEVELAYDTIGVFIDIK